ncbi:hypothetical protein PoB_001587400 [Plakobranchus ocellatus]|uniref:Uncharacterized protein n=1 Tax=Plakobranchus ocellatus TaxID=259542 RepID=A0AAV3Z222_9GAST|nr:hypothetical protein PoB_001587400 [Plakobranchus ocellatus]
MPTGWLQTQQSGAAFLKGDVTCELEALSTIWEDKDEEEEEEEEEEEGGREGPRPMQLTVSEWKRWFVSPVFS